MWGRKGTIKMYQWSVKKTVPVGNIKNITDMRRSVSRFNLRDLVIDWRAEASKQLLDAANCKCRSLECSGTIGFSDRTNVTAYLKLKLVGDLWRNILESNRRSRDSFESNAIEWEARKLAYLHLPLNKWVRTRITVDTQQQKGVTLFIVTIIRIKNTSNFTHHFVCIFCACRLHAPREAQWPWFRWSLLYLQSRHGSHSATGTSNIMSSVFMHWSEQKSTMVMWK